MAARTNSSWAPRGPRSRSRSSLRMRLRSANRISIFLRARRDFSKPSVPTKVRAQPGDGDPASGSRLATRLCSSCHQVLPIFLPDKADPPSFQNIADLPELMEMGVFQGCGSGSGCLKPAAACDDARAGPFIGYLMPTKGFTTATAASFRRRKGSVNGAS